MKKIIMLLCMSVFAITSPLTAFSAEKVSDAPMRSVIVVQNRAGAEFSGKTDVLNDLLANRLAEKGFAIIDSGVVRAAFGEKTDDGSKGAGSGNIAVSDASAQQIARSIGADYVVMATLTSFNQETRTFKGEGTHYGSNNKSQISTLQITVKVLEGNQGGTLYGDMVTVSERVAEVESLKIESNDVVNKLLGTAAVKIADNIGNNIQKIRERKVKAATEVPFTVRSNVDGASVELDGAVVGTTPGKFMAVPGLHQLRVSGEWLAAWVRTVNIFAEQTLSVTLVLSEEGGKRFSTLEQMKSELARKKMAPEAEGEELQEDGDINEQQGDADAVSPKVHVSDEKPVDIKGVTETGINKP